MSLIEIGPRPFAGWIVIVGGETADAGVTDHTDRSSSDVIERAAKSVLNHANEVTGYVAAQTNLQGVAL
jgi:hypothetical protein